MLAFMAAATQELTLTSHKTERRAWDRARVDAALEAGVTQAILGITAPALDRRWRVDGVPRKIMFSGFAVTVTVQAESGRYDLNSIDASVLTALLRSADVDPDGAAALTDSILDWRSPPGLHRIHAASDEDYAAARLPYRPRHAAFQTVEELRLVPGMTPALFKRTRPALTVYTHRPMIDPAIAPREALLALYNGDEDQVNAVLAARNDGDDSASPLHGSSQKGVMNPGISLAGQAFQIAAEITLDRRLFRCSRVVMLTGNRQRPYLTLAWSDD